MDLDLIKELATVPAYVVLVVVIIMQQRQIDRLIDSVIRMQDEVTRNIALFVTGVRELLPDKIDTGKNETPR